MMNQRQVKEKLKQAREAINKKQYCDAVTLCQVITYYSSLKLANLA